jgi:RNA polymerase sigma-70 factor (ECF subfamily)
VVTYLAVDGTRPTVTVTSPQTVDRQTAGPAGAAPAPGTMAGGSTDTTDLTPEQLPGSWQTGTPAFLAGLPRDTGALRARLYADTAGQGPSADGEAFTSVADLLRSGLVPADLRAALYRVLATVPGVEITSATASVDGVRGVGLGRLEDGNGLRQEIVVDPGTGDLVGERTVAVRAIDGLAAGTVLDSRRSTRVLVDAVPASVLAHVHVSRCTVAADGAVGCTG